MSQAPSNLPDGVPFSFFCSLIREIARIRPRQSNHQPRDHGTSDTYPALEVFERWIRQLNAKYSPLPLGTTAICFRLLFPEEDTRRKYNMQETNLAEALTGCLGISGNRLFHWASEGYSGSLGEELRKELERSCSTVDGYICSFTIAQVDELLDELASNSGFSHASIHKKYAKGVRRSRIDVLRLLYRNVSPLDASFLTQVILKDVRPVLYPVTEFHYTAALKNFKSNAVVMLTKEHAMKAWDPRRCMLRFYHARSNIDEAAAYFELPVNRRPKIAPVIGIPVDIPKSTKGQSCRHALSFFRKSKKVWAEIKYDGERAQIHIQVLADSTSRITIFSKSKRDSTQDRQAIHHIIRDTLGLPNDHRNQHEAKVKFNVILDAEMVAWQGDSVDEFWRIKKLVEDTAHGIRGSRNQKQTRLPMDLHSHDSIGGDESENRHLALVFFDVLFLDNVSLLSVPYTQRRETLGRLIEPIPGKAMLSERFAIDTTRNQQRHDLRKFFAAQLADHQEGLVLKAEESRYNDFFLPWVKLKLDYIPGLGDGIDLVILGAGWEKERARALRVGPGTFTTFYIGVLSNSRERAQNPNVRPHFLTYFTASYGMSREQLEETNFLFRNSDNIPYQAFISNEQLPFTFALSPALKPLPSIILCTPLAAELYGAGFTKSQETEHYELRFPRISKIYRSRERSWNDCLDVQSLDKIALEASGKDRADKDIDDMTKELFGQIASPRAKCVFKRKRVAEDREEMLAARDREDEKRAGEPISPVTKRSREESINHPAQTFFLSQPLAAKTNILDTYSTSLSVGSPRATSTADQITQLTELPTSSPRHLLEGGNEGPPDASSLLQDGVVTFSEHVPGKNSLIGQTDDGSPNEDTFEALVWLAPQHRGYCCTSCLSWKKGIARDRRLHSIESLLSGCGWGPDSRASAVASWIKLGVIFLLGHGQDRSNQATRIMQTFEEVKQCTPSGQQCKPVWVFTCRTRTLERRNAVFALE